MTPIEYIRAGFYCVVGGGFALTMFTLAILFLVIIVGGVNNE